MKFYTVDHTRQLIVGQEILCDQDFSGRRFYPVQDHYTQTDLERFADSLFPDGLSRHGKQYLLDELIVIKSQSGTPLSVCPVMPVIELVSELVRRANFPGRPSRFTSIFAWETKEEALAFRESHRGGQGTICRVSAGSYFRGDMNLLFLGGTILGSWLYATRYWSGETSPTPRMECLLTDGVFVEDISE